jgi:uncharacterized DUF497 family protein
VSAIHRRVVDLELVNIVARLRFGFLLPSGIVCLNFRWDAQKAQENLRKHGVGFHEAKTIFGDPLAKTFPDEDHSIYEHRFITLGLSEQLRILVVVHLDENDEIHIISARRATRRERISYEERDI